MIPFPSKVRNMDLQTDQFLVEGLHCASCVSRVESELRKIPGVVDASVNLASREALVTSLMGKVQGVDLRQAVSNAGCRLLPLSSTPAANEHSLSNQRQSTAWLTWFLSLLLAVPVAVISMLDLGLPYRNWVLCLLSFPVVFGLGWPFWQSAIRGIRHFRADMNTLIALGTGVAFFASLLATVAPDWWPAGQHPHVFYEAAVMIVVFVSLGRLLEERARHSAADAVQRLLSLQAPTVLVRRGGQEMTIPSESVVVDDIVIVRPGERISVDGVLLEGTSWIDESMLSGEAIPVAKQTGDLCFAGTLNQAGGLVIKATAVGNNTVLQQIVRLVAQAQGSKAPIARLADRVSAWFVPAILLISGLTFLGWLFAGPPQTSLSFAIITSVSVLIIACPCALGLATPTAIMVGTGKGAELGILIKSGEALEVLHRSTVVVFDKTGTLTVGRPVVQEVNLADTFHFERGEVLDSTLEVPSDRLLAFAAAVESRSEHPLATAVTQAARERQLQIPQITHFHVTPGMGVEGSIAGSRIAIGSRRFLETLNVRHLPTEFAGDRHSVEGSDKPPETRLWIAIREQFAGEIVVQDEIKSNAAECVQMLQGMGLEIQLLTGDRHAVALQVAGQVGISEDKILSEVLPSAKSEEIQRLREKGQRVVMVGDGINDAPALALADVGIALGSGTDVAMESSDIVLPSSDLAGVAMAIQLSRATMVTIRQNLFLAFIYNALCIPVAAGVLYPLWHHLLDPMWASAAMALSSVSVVGNSLRLRHFRPTIQRQPDSNSIASKKHSPERASTSVVATTPVQLVDLQLTPWDQS